jgi:hypothetical protein
MNKKINNVKAPPLKIQGIKTKLVSFIMLKCEMGWTRAMG